VISAELRKAVLYLLFFGFKRSFTIPQTIVNSYSQILMIAFGVSSLDEYVQMLEKEVNIVFCWSMNRIIFDKTVNEDPVTFAFVTLPERHVEQAPQRGSARRILTLYSLLVKSDL